MSTNMEVDSPKDTRIAVHPLAIVHMSDQYTRISCGGSPLIKSAPVVGLLFGCQNEQGVWHVHDADDIPTEISEASTIQVNLHKAVFPKNSVVGWYRVVSGDASSDPTAQDLQITKQLKQNYAPDSTFCFCLLQVQQQQQQNADKKPEATSSTSSASNENSTLNKELPINLYELATVENNTTVLLGLSNKDQWQLETAEPERIAVERVMKEKPSSHQQNEFVTQTQALHHSLQCMKERIRLLIEFLQATHEGKIPPNHSLLRQVQGLLLSLGPLGTSITSMNSGSSGSSKTTSNTVEDAELVAHLAAVAKTLAAVQSYTDKFRVLHENRTVGKEMRRAL